MRFLRAAVFGVVIALVMAACAQQPASPQRVNWEGNIAYYTKRYPEAVTKFELSLALAEKNGDKQYAAIAMLGLARSYAQLCLEQDAEQWFKKSIVARESLPDIEYAHLTVNLFEYGRFLASWGRAMEAAGLYERALPLLDASSTMQKDDPFGYALVLDEYETLLRSAARKADAEAVAARAKSLRASNEGKTARFKPEPYPNCRSEAH